jgi:hypothetical protein
MRKPFDAARYVSRKFLAWVVVITLSTSALFWGKLTPGVWLQAVLWATGIYVAGNVAQKALLAWFTNGRETLP